MFSVVLAFWWESSDVQLRRSIHSPHMRLRRDGSGSLLSCDVLPRLCLQSLHRRGRTCWERFRARWWDDDADPVAVA